MVDKKTKQKIKRFWCVSVCAIVTLSFSIIKVRSVLQANQTYNEYKQVYETYEMYEASRQAYEASRQAYEAYKAYKASRQASEAYETSKQLYEAFILAHEASRQVYKAYKAFILAHETSRQAYEKSRQAYEASRQAYQTSRQAYQTSKSRQAYETYKAYGASRQAFNMIKNLMSLQISQMLSVGQVSKSKTDLQLQNLKWELSTLGISALCFIVMLIVLLNQLNQISLSLTGQLICFIPEECVAEIEALRQQLKSEHLSTWVIRIIIFKNVLELFLAFYVQINLENLWLPQHKRRKNIDE